VVVEPTADTHVPERSLRLRLLLLLLVVVVLSGRLAKLIQLELILEPREYAQNTLVSLPLSIEYHRSDALESLIEVKLAAKTTTQNNISSVLLIH
jgi:hypothetical protein